MPGRLRLSGHLRSVKIVLSCRYCFTASSMRPFFTRLQSLYFCTAMHAKINPWRTFFLYCAITTVPIPLARVLVHRLDGVDHLPWEFGPWGGGGTQWFHFPAFHEGNWVYFAIINDTFCIIACTSYVISVATRQATNMCMNRCPYYSADFWPWENSLPPGKFSLKQHDELVQNTSNPEVIYYQGSINLTILPQLTAKVGLITVVTHTSFSFLWHCNYTLN